MRHPSTPLARACVHMSFSRSTTWHGQPMSWDAATPPETAHKASIGGIKVGFAGFVPKAQSHYGSSHVGSLPYRDRRKWDRGVMEKEARRRTNAHDGLNQTSAREVGRQAWALEWVGHGQVSSCRMCPTTPKALVSCHFSWRLAASLSPHPQGLGEVQARRRQGW